MRFPHRENGNMPDNFDDDVEDNDTPLVKDLRKQLREADKDRKELRQMAEGLSKKDRERSLADTFKARNISEKVANFYPSDKAASEDDINAWLKENAEVFGLKLDAPPADGPPAAEIPQGMQRLQSITQPSMTETGEAAMLHQINQAATAEELTAMIVAAGGGAVS